MPTITLWPEGGTLEVEEGKPLLAQLIAAGKVIKSSCGGHATCGDCVVKVKGGESCLVPPTFEELRLLGNVFHITKERLSCQLKVTGDVVLDLSAHAKAPAKPVVGPKGAPVLVRKRQDVQETALKSQEKEGEKTDDAWYRHWEKQGDPSKAPPKLGGGRRPRPFKHDNDDGNNTDN